MLYDAGIFNALVDFLNGLKHSRIHSILFEKAYTDGSEDYWSYNFSIKKHPFSNKVAHFVKLSGYANGKTCTVSELEKFSKEFGGYLTDVATILLASKSFEWFPNNREAK